jgi:hypothetical protein
MKPTRDTVEVIHQILRLKKWAGLRPRLVTHECRSLGALRDTLMGIGDTIYRDRSGDPELRKISLDLARLTHRNLTKMIERR